jgi:hypothetical protein
VSVRVDSRFLRHRRYVEFRFDAVNRTRVSYVPCNTLIVLTVVSWYLVDSVEILSEEELLMSESPKEMR